MLTVDHICRVYRVPPWLVDPSRRRPRFPRLAFAVLRACWWMDDKWRWLWP